MSHAHSQRFTIISPQDEFHYFFGYYDLMPYHVRGDLHLAHRVGFMDRLPRAGDKAGVGYICLESGTFMQIAHTQAWNFQQGSLLQWMDERSVIYNDFLDGRFVSVISGMDGKLLHKTDMPAACISNDRRRALSINFSRIYDFRPGYGYANLPDKNAHIHAPKNDGIFLIDLAGGTSTLLISYADMAKQLCYPPFDRMKLVVNHITFNPSGNRFCFLLRTFPDRDGKWHTMLVSGDLKGNMRALTGFTIHSHYSFKNDEELLIVTSETGMEGLHLALFNMAGGGKTEVFRGKVNEDIHCLYAPDTRFIVGDGYPDSHNERHIFVLDSHGGTVRDICKFYSPPPALTDIRCDLHTRFNRAGDKISLDTTHNGKREIAELDFEWQ